MLRGIQAAQHELEKQKITDNLKKGLGQRPERDALIERKSTASIWIRLTHISTGNILPDSTAAPALQKHQKELEKHMKMDALEKKMQERPKADELVREGILEAGEDGTKA